MQIFQASITKKYEVKGGNEFNITMNYVLYRSEQYGFTEYRIIVEHRRKTIALPETVKLNIEMYFYMQFL